MGAWADNRFAAHPNDESCNYLINFPWIYSASSLLQGSGGGQWWRNGGPTVEVEPKHRGTPFAVRGRSIFNRFALFAVHGLLTRRDVLTGQKSSLGRNTKLDVDARSQLSNRQKLS